MKTSILRTAMAVLAFVAFGTVVPSTASAAANPPHHTTVTKSANGCTVQFTHGNFYGGAYAKMTVGNSSGCNSGTYVRVGAWDGSKVVHGPTCFTTSTSCIIAASQGVATYQSFRGGSNILGSVLRLCGSGGCTTLNLPGL